jgi:V/A-type H+-transporting ATPase subunit K
MEVSAQIFTLILTGLGFGCMVGLSGCGSAIGCVIAGSSVIGSIKKRPETFGVNLVLQALPGTQGLYGFVGFMIYSQLLQAQMQAGEWTLLKGAVLFGIGASLGLVNLISAIKQGQVCAAGISAIGSGNNVFGNTLILAAFPEFYAILSLIASIILSNSIMTLKF